MHVVRFYEGKKENLRAEKRIRGGGGVTENYH